MYNRIPSQKPSIRNKYWLFLGPFCGGTEMNRGNIRTSQHVTGEGRQRLEKCFTHKVSTFLLKKKFGCPGKNKTKSNQRKKGFHTTQYQKVRGLNAHTGGR